METVGEPTWGESMRSVRPGGVVCVSGTTGGASNGPTEAVNFAIKRCILRVGRGSKTGAGAVVTKDIPERSLAVGVPARVARSVDDR